MYNHRTDHEIDKDDVKALAEAKRVRIVMDDQGYALVPEVERSNPADYTRQEWGLFPERGENIFGELVLRRRIPVHGTAYDWTSEDEDNVWHFSRVAGHITTVGYLQYLIKPGASAKLVITSTRNRDGEITEEIDLHLDWKERGKYHTIMVTLASQRATYRAITSGHTSQPQERLG